MKVKDNRGDETTLFAQLMPGHVAQLDSGELLRTFHFELVEPCPDATLVLDRPPAPPAAVGVDPCSCGNPSSEVLDGEPLCSWCARGIAEGAR